MSTPPPPTPSSTLARKTAQTFITNFNLRNFPAMTSLFNPSATYYMSGDPARYPWSGTKLASERFPRLIPLMSAFAEFDVRAPQGIVVEGGKAVLEFSLRGKMAEEKGGIVYENEGVMVLEVDEEGLIVALREYIENERTLRFTEAMAGGEGEEGKEVARD